MDKLPLPNSYVLKEIGKNQAEIIIEPCYPGYGNTLGNSLRRVLLSSLKGSAVTSLKIKGVTHEFSAIKGVKEDFVEIILNLKRLRFNIRDADEAKATLKVKGEKKVTASDLKVTSDTEIVTPDAKIATLTSKDSELELELTIKTGRGYQPVENIEKKKFQLGTIAIDAIYTPIVNVNYSVENVRVGQMTNYDKLILQIKTDGTITPEDALKSASAILVEHFSEISQKDVPAKSGKDAEEKKELTIEASKVAKEKEEKIEETKPKKKRGRPKKQ